jgi:hypothetical protein
VTSYAQRVAAPVLSRQKRLVGSSPEVESGEGPAQIMLRSRRGKPVYLVYDEDAFLASPSGGLAAAPSPRPPRSGRGRVSRGRWTLALAVTLTAATTAQFVASRVNHAEVSPSRRIDGHAQTGRDRSVPAAPRPLGRRIALSAAPLSASRANGAVPHRAPHHQARRARQAAGPGHPRPLPESSGRPPAPAPAPAARPFSPTPSPSPAATHPGQSGTGAAHEFGFEG